MPIDLLSRHAEKQRPGPYATTVISQLPNLNGAIANHPGRTSYAGKLIQSHSADSRSGPDATSAYSCGTPRYGRAKPAILPNAGAATDPP